MTVAVGTGRSDVWTADGTNRDWPFPFKVLSADHVRLQVTPPGGSASEISSGFSVIGLAADTGGHVVYPIEPAAALPAGTTVQVVRRVPLSQPNRIGNQGGFHARTHEDTFDLVVMQVEQTSRDLADRLTDLDAEAEAAIGRAVQDGDFVSQKLGFKRVASAGLTTVAAPMIRKLSEVFSPRDYGALGDGTASDNKLADAVLAAIAENKTLLIPGDTPAAGFTLSVPIVIDISSTTTITGRKRPSIIGESTGTSRINYTGTGGLFRLIGTTQANEGYHFFNEIRDLTLVGPGKATPSSALDLSHVAHLHCEALKIENFGYAIYAEDLEFSRFYRCDLRRNAKGFFATQRAVPTPNSSHPNNNVFRDCDISLNDDYGMYVVGGTQVMLRDCQVAYNGLAGGSSRWGVKVENSGYQGGVGLNVSGGYFEHNGGVADIVIQSTAAALASANPAVHDIIGASFARVTSATVPQAPAQHHVYVSLHANGGQQKVNLIGCGFKVYNQYVPSASNPVVGFDPASPRSSLNFFAAGNMFMSSVEAIGQQGTAEAFDTYAGNVDIGAIIPIDDTIPQITEGSQALTASILLNSPKNKVVIEVDGAFAMGGGTAGTVVFALFRGSEANAIAVAASTAAGVNLLTPVRLMWEDAPGSIYGNGPVTYTVRVGPGAGTARLNGTSTGRLFGGAMRATLKVREIQG